MTGHGHEGRARAYGRFRVERPLGAGGMGAVLLVTDTVLDRPAAVKVVAAHLVEDPEFRLRFQREAEALARLDSPHVVQILDHGVQDGEHYLATQYVAGGDLGALVESAGPLPASEALRVCAQVASALHDAHRIGIVHRDVKASNVLVRDPGADRLHVYLCDFGIAKTEGDDLTSAGGVAGTWAYLAPERAAGAPASAASDVYAVGCLLWYCLTGRTPYVGHEAAVVLGHRDGAVPRLGGDDVVPAAVDPVLERALAKDPADRFPDAAALDAVPAGARAETPAGAAAPPTVVAAGGRAPTHRPDATTLPTPRRRATADGTRRRRGLLLGAAALAAVLVVAGVVAALSLDGDDAPAPEAPTARGPVSGDVDGDGLGDATVFQRRASNLRPIARSTLLSTGSAFGPATQDPLTTEGLQHLADIDGDGRLDTVAEGGSTLFSEEAELTVTPGSGADPWTATVPVPVVTFGVYPTLMFADADGDGRDDVLVAGSSEDDRTAVYVGSSTGSSFDEATQWYGAEGDWTNASILAGDVDGDDDADVLVAAVVGDDEAWRVILTDGGAMASGDPRTFSGTPGRDLGEPLLGDVDDDGADEVVLPGGGGRTVAVLEVGDGVVEDPSTWVTSLDGDVGSTFGRFTLSDVDGDGADDLLWLRGPADGVLDLQALLSTGSSFDAPAPWGVLGCASECRDEFVFPLPS